MLKKLFLVVSQNLLRKQWNTIKNMGDAFLLAFDNMWMTV